MADLIRAMLYHCLVPGLKLFTIPIPIIIKTITQAIAAISSALSQYIISSHYSLPLGICDHLLPSLRSRWQKDDNSGLAFAFLFIALAFLTVICIGRIIHVHLSKQIHPDTIRLHALERAVTRQIEINYHLSRSSQNRKLQNPNCSAAEFEQWTVHWSQIKRLREQAEADFKHGAPTWYYDDDPDFAQRYHELRNELARLHSLGRNIVNAREEAKRYIGDTVGGRNGALTGGEDRMRRKFQAVEAAQVDEMDTKGRSGHHVSKASRGKAIFQQHVDTVGRVTPGGRFG